MTFLVSSIVFVGGLFFYAKLNRNAISGEKLYSSVSNRVKIMKYMRFNFNYSEYQKLKDDKEKMKRLIEMYYCKH